MATNEATSPPQYIGVVIGENVRRLREAYKMTQSDLARRANWVGLKWGRSHIAALEAGNRESLDLATMALLARALDVPIPDLIEGEGPVRLSAEATAPRSGLRYSMQGVNPGYVMEGVAGERMDDDGRRYVRVDTYGGGDTQMPVIHMATSIRADVELAERLGVPPEQVTSAAERMWGRSLHQERDKRLREIDAGLSANQRRARRGHITRQLAKEIYAAMARLSAKGDT